MDDGPGVTNVDNALFTSQVELHQDPELGGLFTGPVPVLRGTGFAPLKEITVEVSCRDGNDRLWKSANEYLVSAEGVFDTSETASVGEGYYGIAREGPFYSMVCQDGPYPWQPRDPIHYEVCCSDAGQSIFQAALTRSLGRPSAALPPPHAAVLVFDDGVTSDQSDAVTVLRSHGIEARNALLPKGQVGDFAQAWTQRRPESPVFIVGCGRASALALECARRSKDLQGVILFSGGGLRFDPLRDENGDLDHIRLDHSSLHPKAEGILVTRKLYAEAVADKTNRERGRIEVEDIACPIYMFSGLDDQIWPASAFSELVAQRRKMKACSHPTFHRTFEGVGHDLGPSLGLPTLPTTERTVDHPDTGFRLLLGGKPGRQARARRECWDTLLEILHGNPPQI